MGIAKGCLGYVARNEVQFIWEDVLNNKVTPYGYISTRLLCMELVILSDHSVQLGGPSVTTVTPFKFFNKFLVEQGG